jgi:O-antigen ligase/polysaccharide polymerase Wzy-like membrane protein
MIAGSAPRGSVVSAAVVVTSISVLAATVVGGRGPSLVAPAVTLIVLLAVASRRHISWHSLLALTILVILIIPIRRYRLPGGLPFELEPYRLVVALIVAGWLISLLVDPQIRLRRTGFEGPIALIVVAVVASLFANPLRVEAVEPTVVKKVMFLASFVLLFYLIVSCVRTVEAVDYLIRVLVGGGSVVAVFAIVESRTGYNVFNHLSSVVPILDPFRVPSEESRGGRLRVFASSQHPIALGAMFVILIPLAIYLARRSGRRLWHAVAVVLAFGALATVSRTSIVMLIVVGLVFVWLRPGHVRRLWPLAVPALIAVHIALPGTLGTLKAAFFPPGGLVAEQQFGAGTRGSGRIADLGPSLREYSAKPLFGQGFGTRIVDREGGNAPILDDQWLGTLLELGAIGALGWLWLFVRAIRRLGRAAKEDESEVGWLLAAIAASVAAFAVGMFTYDTFAFIQVTFVLFILLGLGASVLLGRAVTTAGGDRAALRA